MEPKEENSQYENTEVITISDKILANMDATVSNYKNGIASESINISIFREGSNEYYGEKFF